MCKKKEHQLNNNSGQEFTNVLKDILIPNDTTENNKSSTIWLIRGQEVPIWQFTIELVAEVKNHLINSGYTLKELEEEPRHLEHELIDCMNEAIAYGEEVNGTYFKVKTPSHIVAFLELMEKVKEYL